MKIVKTILRYLMYGIVLFLMSGFMFSMIKNSDKSVNSKKIFDDTRNFASSSVPKDATTKKTQEKPEYVPQTKPYKKNQSDCARVKERADLYTIEANKFNMDTSKSACEMAKNLDQVVDLMQRLKQSSCSEFNEITFKTYKNLHKMSITTCRQ